MLAAPASNSAIVWVAVYPMDFCVAAVVYPMPFGAPKSVKVVPSTCARMVHPNFVSLVQNSAWALGKSLTWEPGSHAVKGSVLGGGAML